MNRRQKVSKYFPDPKGYYGNFGGMFIPETLMAAHIELDRGYKRISKDKKFKKEMKSLLSDYAGRPTPLYFAEQLSQYSGCRVYLKREDLCFTGAHKINNCIGQGLLAKYLNKKRIIAETGAGQHGVATATIAAKLGFPCTIYMGAKDVERQKINVFRMKLLGATVVAVTAGSKTLKDAMNEALRDWVTNVDNTHYIIGSAAGSHPFPMIVRNFQSVIGSEAKQQIRKVEGRMPDAVYACVGGGSNAIGIFYPFIDTRAALVGVEAGGVGSKEGMHSATLVHGKPGILHGMRTELLSRKDGNISDVHSVAAGLDYPGVGPEHSYLKSIKRARYISVTDKAALNAFHKLTLLEGISPAFESAHAVAGFIREKNKYTRRSIVIINISGRGDKDIPRLFGG